MKNKISPNELFLELSLYSKVEWKREDVFSIAELLFFRGTIDAYCLGCERDSTFYGENGYTPVALTLGHFKNDKRKIAACLPTNGPAPSAPEYPLIPPRIYTTSLSCARNNDHKIKFLYFVQSCRDSENDDKAETKQVLEKIGQFPSFAELNLPSIKKYRKVLQEDVYPDLARGVGLAAHGVGIGAYVYLRRVFERLVEESHGMAAETEGWDEKAYEKMRMAEKVKSLKGHLPDFLVDHPEIYSLLSEGLHELSEETCLKHFPALRIGIELILDEKIENKERRKKIEEASKAIKNISVPQ